MWRTFVAKLTNTPLHLSYDSVPEFPFSAVEWTKVTHACMNERKRFLRSCTWQISQLILKWIEMMYNTSYATAYEFFESDSCHPKAKKYCLIVNKVLWIAAWHLRECISLIIESMTWWWDGCKTENFCSFDNQNFSNDRLHESAYHSRP